MASPGLRDGERLWVASGRYGIGVADLRGLRDVAPVRDGSWSKLEHRAVPTIEYQKASDGRAVVGLATVPREGGCFALLAEGGGSEPRGFEWFSTP